MYKLVNDVSQLMIEISIATQSDTIHHIPA